MKILMYTSYYHPHVSGLTLYFERLAEEYVKKGHEVTMLTSKHDGNLANQESINGVKVHRSPVLFKVNKGLAMPRLFFDAFKLVKNVDVVHLNLPSFEAIWVAFAAKIFKKKVVSTYVCDITLPKICCRKLLEIIIDITHNKTLWLSDRILSFTKDFASHSRILKKYKNIDGVLPIVVLQSEESKVEVLSDLKSQQKVVIGMATRIASEKGIDDVIAMLPQIEKQIPNIHLVIAGNLDPIGEDKYVLKIQKLLKQHSGKVTLLGNLNSTQMKYFYKNIDVLVIASTNSTEAFGMVQAEAMLEGTPAVVTDLPGVRVPVQQTDMGEIAKIGNMDDLQNKIIKVLKNRSKYTDGKSKAIQMFDRDAVVTKSLAIYDKLI